MKPIHFLICFLGLWNSSCADILKLRNKDQLHGQMVGLQTMPNLESAQGSPALGFEDQVHWHSPLFSDKATFFTKDLEFIELSNPSELSEAQNTQIKLANGDTYVGRLIALNDKVLSIDTDYSGRLDIRREFIQLIRFLAKSDYAYFGPNSLTEWKQSHPEQPEWNLVNGWLTTEQSSSSIGLERKVTQYSHLSFTAKWSDTLYLSINLMANTAQPDAVKDAYQAQISSSQINCSRIGGNADNNRNAFWGGGEQHAIPNNDQARFDLFCDRNAGRIFIFMNGKQVKSWTDPNPDPKNLGGGFQFINRSNSSLHITDIEFLPWDGILPDQKTKAELENFSPIDGDRLDFINGDKTNGKIGGIQNDKLSLKSENLDLSIPLDRIIKLNLFNPYLIQYKEMPKPRLWNRDVRVILANGSQVTFRALGFDQGSLIGMNEAFGPAKLNLKYAKRIEFYPY